MSYEAWLRGDNVDASKTIFVATEMLAFDFELFIGGRCGSLGNTVALLVKSDKQTIHKC